VGAFILALSFFVFLVNIWQTSRKPRNAPADPWNGATLEWSIPSPPQEWNFAELPVVHGRDALWEAKRQRGGTWPEPVRVSGKGIHLPNPSIWPLVTALGIAAVFTSLMALGHDKAGAGLVVAAVLLLFFGIYRWAFEPAG
jgi:cytochrome c oxidase subunit 1